MFVRVIIFLLLSVLAGSAGAAQVYRWVDDQGKTHFSDKPPAHLRDLEAQQVDGVTTTRGARARVVMLSTRTCSICKKAKGWLRAKGVPFIEYDIDSSSVGKREFKRVQGNGVPVILVGADVVYGFRKGQLKSLLVEAGYLKK